MPISPASASTRWVARNSAWWVAGSIDSPGRDVQQLAGVLLEQAAHVRPVLGFLGAVVEVHAAVPLVGRAGSPQRGTGHP